MEWIVAARAMSRNLPSNDPRDFIGFIQGGLEECSTVAVLLSGLVRGQGASELRQGAGGVSSDAFGSDTGEVKTSVAEDIVCGDEEFGTK